MKINLRFIFLCELHQKKYVVLQQLYSTYFLSFEKCKSPWLIPLTQQEQKHIKCSHR